MPTLTCPFAVPESLLEFIEPVRINCPPATVIAPLKVFAPDSVRSPAPLLLKPSRPFTPPAPSCNTPENTSLAELLRSSQRSTILVPAGLPVLPFSTMPLPVSPPALKSLALFVGELGDPICSLPPPVILISPVILLCAPLATLLESMVNVPGPDSVRPNAPEMGPTVRSPLATLTVREVPEPPSVTAPVPMFRSLDPVKVKLPLQVCGILLASVRGLPRVLLTVPPEIVKVPVPSARRFED